MAQILAILAMFLLLVLIGAYPIPCAHPGEPPAPDAKQKQYSGNNAAVPALGAVSQSDSHRSQAGADDKYCPYPLSEPCLWAGCIVRRTVTDPTLLFLALAAIFTLAVAIFTGFLYVDGRKKGRQELRAYISGSPNYVHTFSTTDTRISLTVFNRGQTPANRVKTTGIVDILQYPLPMNYSFPKSTVPVSNGTTVHPEEPITVTFVNQRNFSAQEITDAAGNNGKALYLFGTIFYDDIFGIKQTTNFCRSAVGSNALATIVSNPAVKVDLAFEISSQHNDAT